MHTRAPIVQPGAIHRDFSGATGENPVMPVFGRRLPTAEERALLLSPPERPEADKRTSRAEAKHTPFESRINPHYL